MAVVEGFWVAGLEGTEARMNACLTLIGTAAEITALNAATYKRCFAYATNTYQFYYSNGSTWVVMGIGVHTHQSDGQGGHLVDGVDVSVLKALADTAYGLANTVFNEMDVCAVDWSLGLVSGTVYQNTTGKIQFLKIYARILGTATYPDNVIKVILGAANPPNVQVSIGENESTVDAYREASCFIPPGWFYKPVCVNPSAPLLGILYTLH